ncbi:MAG: fumarate/nitrate reduction transcriptional regulator Fnr [Burkholderiales bacterium]
MFTTAATTQSARVNSPIPIHKVHGTGEIVPLPVHAGTKSKCTDCLMHQTCVPKGLSVVEWQQLEGLITTHKRIARGESLYRDGEKFDYLYAIRSGFFKTSVLIEDGRDQVTAFHMAGDVLGIDGIGSGVHTCDAVVLEDAEVCVISFQQYERLSGKIVSMRQHLYKMMSREIVRDYSMMMLLGTMRAEERLATFLLDLSERFTSRGYSPKEFILRMTREEIGSYLGLKLETVSRMFSKFQNDGLVSAQQKHIQILDADKLRQVIGNCH